MDKKLEARVRRLEKLLNVYEDSKFRADLEDIYVGMPVIDLKNNRRAIVVDYGDMGSMFDKYMDVVTKPYSEYSKDAKHGIYSNAAIIKYRGASRKELIVDPEENLIEDDE